MALRKADCMIFFAVTINDLINAHSQINGSYLINAPSNKCPVSNRHPSHWVSERKWREGRSGGEYLPKKYLKPLLQNH